MLKPHRALAPLVLFENRCTDGYSIVAWSIEVKVHSVEIWNERELVPDAGSFRSFSTGRYRTYSKQLILRVPPHVSSSHHESRSRDSSRSSMPMKTQTSPLNAKQMFKPIVVTKRYQKMKYISLHLTCKSSVRWRNERSIAILRRVRSWSNAIDKDKPLIHHHDVVQRDHGGLEKTIGMDRRIYCSHWHRNRWNWSANIEVVRMSHKSFYETQCPKQCQVPDDLRCARVLGLGIQLIDGSTEQFHSQNRKCIIKALSRRHHVELVARPRRCEIRTKRTPKNAPPFRISSITVPTMIWMFVDAGKKRTNR